MSFLSVWSFVYPWVYSNTGTVGQSIIVLHWGQRATIREPRYQWYLKIIMGRVNTNNINLIYELDSPGWFDDGKNITPLWIYNYHTFFDVYRQLLRGCPWWLCDKLTFVKERIFHFWIKCIDFGTPTTIFIVNLIYPVVLLLNIRHRK